MVSLDINGGDCEEMRIVSRTLTVKLLDAKALAQKLLQDEAGLELHKANQASPPGGRNFPFQTEAPISFLNGDKFASDSELYEFRGISISWMLSAP